MHHSSELFVARGDVEGLARGIRELLGNAGARGKIGLAARRRIHEHFEIEQAMQRLQSAIVCVSNTSEGLFSQPWLMRSV